VSVTSPASTEEAGASRSDASSVPEVQSHRVAWQHVTLAALLVVTVPVNLWWVAAHRSGLPFDIDEAGYLQRAVRDADALHAGGLASLWSTVRLPDPQAPLLTVIGGIFRWATGAGIYRMLAMQQLFYVVVVLSTYWGARQLANRNWSLLAAVMVAAVPGVVDSSRAFNFALPATAMLTATLAVQLRTDAFRTLAMSVFWGVLLGLSALTRTVSISLLPPLILAAVLSVVLSRPQGKQALNLGVGLLLGVLVAGSWYSATWRPVLQYLTGFGYGADASKYGAARSVLSLGWWTFRLNRAVNTELFAPLALAIALCFVAGLVTWWRHRSGRTGAASGHHPAAPLAEATGRYLRDPRATVWIFVAGGFLVLSTSQNAGSMFELPLLPAVIILAASVASRSLSGVRPYVGAACMIAAVTSFVGVSAAIPDVSTSALAVSVGPVHLTAFDGRGTLLSYASSTGGACTPRWCDPSGTTPGEGAYLRAWLPPSRDMAAFLHGYAAAHGCDPVVFFAVEDPLFDTNTVDLAYQLSYSEDLPTGLLKTRGEAGETPFRQLQDPALGIPNLVIIGPAPRYSRTFSSLVGRGAGLAALKEDGFEPVGGLSLPDGRVMSVWWKDRGPCDAGHQ
jgi:4-amino-4-deoxy-L-arabinose transferase-like glycosyltransferase